MSIPNDNIIQKELLVLINSQPTKRILASIAYKVLAKLHPELTEEEQTQKYQNSVSKWANRVQFARLHLVNEGLLYRAGMGPNAGYGYWVLTPKGSEKAQEISFSQHTATLDEIVIADLDSIKSEEHFEEGGKFARLVSLYERNPTLRSVAIKTHGTTCKACGFNFAAIYGERGKDYIEVHHLVPISTYIEPTKIDPINDLTVLCSNCHRMIHRKKEKPLSLDELIEIVNKNNSSTKDATGYST